MWNIYRDSPGILIVLIFFQLISFRSGIWDEWDSQVVETRLFLVFNVFNDLWDSTGLSHEMGRAGVHRPINPICSAPPTHPPRQGVQWTIAHPPWISPGKSRERGSRGSSSLSTEAPRFQPPDVLRSAVISLLSLFELTQFIGNLYFSEKYIHTGSVSSFLA